MTCIAIVHVTYIINLLLTLQILKTHQVHLFELAPVIMALTEAIMVSVPAPVAKEGAAAMAETALHAEFVLEATKSFEFLTVRHPQGIRLVMLVSLTQICKILN